MLLKINRRELKLSVEKFLTLKFYSVNILKGICVLEIRDFPPPPLRG